MNDPSLETGRTLETEIHPSSIVDPGAELGQGVVIGPWSIIGPRVRVGDGTRVGPHVLVERDTTIGADCQLHQGAVLGTDPQDLKFRGEETILIVGDRTVVREYATLNRGTADLHQTVVGDDCLLMAYSHIAHDCQIGNNVVISNAVNMAGHVFIEDWAIVGGLTAIHQFVRIGAHAFVGGASRTSQDVPPYTRAAGSPMKLYGLNSIGLDRRGFSKEVRQALKTAYRAVFQSSLPLTQGLEQAEAEAEDFPEVRQFLSFIRSSERGVTT
ncbi:MAG: acyl-ACP--UDP-N-acetylglucosamine O-acyltransferase [Gemmatimonadetes bacterium]|nr:acyl-ACP--UDP-N-acetylglucosamine O-acyltransferase [Gemmatimonadota bacterium]NNM07223.1 acyl-ACP--UDP-N-acetylglucosamine O-acyltransferase [Gemmatimonadota bacterium]